MSVIQETFHAALAMLGSICNTHIFIFMVRSLLKRAPLTPDAKAAVLALVQVEQQPVYYTISVRRGCATEVPRS